MIEQQLQLIGVKLMCAFVIEYYQSMWRGYKMTRKKEEGHSARILKSGLLALALVMVLFGVSVVPVTAADGDSDVNSESIGSGVGFEEPFGIAVEADGSIVVADNGLDAVVRVDPITGNRTTAQAQGDEAFAWIRVGDTEFTGGLGEVVISIDNGFLIFRQYRANTKLDIVCFALQENGSISPSWRKTLSKEREEPPDFETGTAAAWDKDQRLYFLLGAYEEEQRCCFYVYNLGSDSWTKLADTPEKQGAGNALVYVKGEEGSFLYAFVGQRARRSAFLRYRISEDRWEKLEVPEAWIYTDDGASLVWPQDGYLYALQGSGYEDMPTPSFARFHLPDGPWESLHPILDPEGVNDGGSLAWDGNRYIYAISGGYGETKGWKEEASGKEFYRYDLEGGLWERETLAPLPCPIGCYTGNRLAVVDNFLFLWQGTPGSWECGGGSIWLMDLAP